MKRLVCLILMMILLCSFACAEVYTTGNVNLRVGPGLGYDVVTAVAPGETLEFVGGVSVDDRGVEWYSVMYGGQECWISSKYSVLEADAQPEPQAMPEMQFIIEPETEGIEISGYYLQNLQAAAGELGLTDYEMTNSEVPNCYSNEFLTLAGNNEVAYIGLFGGDYMIYGCQTGMNIEIVVGMLEGAGLTFARELDGCIVFEHPANENSFVDVDGFDSCINITFDANGSVTGFDWSTYTG